MLATATARSAADDLRSMLSETRLRGRSSFSFFVQRVLGLRLRRGRLEALVGGARAEGTVEQSAVDAWHALHEGRFSDLPLAARALLA